MKADEALEILEKVEGQLSTALAVLPGVVKDVQRVREGIEEGQRKKAEAEVGEQKELGD